MKRFAITKRLIDGTLIAMFFVLFGVCDLGLKLSQAEAQSFSAGVGSEFPLGISVDGYFHLETMPFFLRGRYGRFLAPYTSAMNSIAESFDFYNSATSDIVAESLKNANYFEFGLGWEQGAAEGWYVDLGYNYVKGSGQVTGSTILAAIGVTLPAGGNIYDIEGEIHSVSLRGGYRWLVAESWTIWATAGVLKPVDSTTLIDRDVSGPVQRALLDAANRNVDEYMDDVYKNDVWIPVIGAMAVYNF